MTTSRTELAAAITRLRAARQLIDPTSPSAGPGLAGDLDLVLDAAGRAHDLLAAQERRVRTGAILLETRALLRAAVGRLAEIEAAAKRHHRGDPYGPQGAAASEILELTGNTATVTHLHPAVPDYTGVHAEAADPGSASARHRHD